MSNATLSNQIAPLFSGEKWLLSLPLEAETAFQLLNLIDGTRLNHVQEVVRWAELYVSSCPIRELDLLPISAWFHDIGYSPALRATGFHPLDGAAFLAAKQAPEPLISAVLAHTGAFGEAESHLIAADFYRTWRESDFSSPLVDALTYCDLHASPSGKAITPGERVEDICCRYADSHPVSINIRSRQSQFRDQIRSAFQYTLMNNTDRLPWIFCDVDSTLVPPGSPLSYNVKELVRRYISVGGGFSLATGKHPLAISGLVEEMQLPGPHIALNGTVILSQNQIIPQSSIGSQLPRLLDFLRKSQIAAVGYVANGIVPLTSPLLPAHLNLLAEIGEPGICDHGKNEDFFKILCFVGEDETSKQAMIESETAGLGCHSVRTGHHFYEILPPGVNKGVAMEYILKQKVFPQLLTIAIGDAENDLPMLRRAGFSAVVANSAERLKTAADLVLPSCKEEGIAVLLKKLIEERTLP